MSAPQTSGEGGLGEGAAPSPDSFVNFTVYGLPVPQGSTRAFVVKGRAVTTSANTGLKPWRDTVAAAARDAMGQPPLTGPVRVACVFTLPRPASRRKRDLYPDRKPDLDKLIRGLWDGITGPILVDDAQVCQTVAEKRYVGDPHALAEPGCTVIVGAL